MIKHLVGQNVTVYQQQPATTGFHFSGKLEFNPNVRPVFSVTVMGASVVFPESDITKVTETRIEIRSR